MADQVKIPLDQQAASVEREIGMRKRVYGNWVASGKMKQEKADHEIAAMQAVLVTVKDYRAMQPKVLAMASACLVLGKRLGMTQEELDEMLVEAETQAKVELGAPG